MTGSDWRQYELSYNDFVWSSDVYIFEPGFRFVYLFFKSFGFNFFLALGILKSLYLYTLIKLLHKYTPDWLSSIVLLMPISLLFILIDNPLRFMVALILINISILKLNKKNNIISYTLIILAVLFHQTALFFIIIPIIFKLSNKIYNLNPILLIICYSILVMLSTNAALIDNIMTSSLGLLMTYMDMKDYGSFYSMEDNEAFFTIGSILQIIIFCIIILTKTSINSTDSHRKTIYSIAVFYLFISRVLIMIPTGFRLAIPFGYFFSVYIIDIVKSKRFIGYGLLVYFALAMCKDIYNGYSYIPYTNSLTHIILNDHPSYDNRSKYNMDAYFKRTGKQLESQ